MCLEADLDADIAVAVVRGVFAFAAEQVVGPATPLEDVVAADTMEPVGLTHAKQDVGAVGALDAVYGVIKAANRSHVSFLLSRAGLVGPLSCN